MNNVRKKWMWKEEKTNKYLKRLNKAQSLVKEQRGVEAEKIAERMSHVWGLMNEDLDKKKILKIKTKQTNKKSK